MTILQLGRSGQLATELLRRSDASPSPVVAVGRPDLDVTDAEQLKAMIFGIHDLCAVVNATAYTAVDRAETEPAAAFAVNAESVETMAHACAHRGVPLIHISTDYVFSGRCLAPYLETAAPEPLNIYGASKLEGERRVARACPRHVILRTQWVYSAHGHNFVKTMLRLACNGRSPSVVNDQWGRPTSAGDLADAVLAVVGSIMANRLDPKYFGVFHCTGSGLPATWYELAAATMAASARVGGPSVPITPIGTADYPSLAQRPAHGVLDCSRFTETFNHAMRPWPEALDEVVKELVTNPEINVRGDR